MEKASEVQMQVERQKEQNGEETLGTVAKVVPSRNRNPWQPFKTH